MILAAGFGTRLRPLTDRIAKPALPLPGTTLLECNLALAARAGATEVVVNAHHLPHTVARVAREAADRLSLRLHLCFESGAILGTGGALVAARPLLDRGAPFLLLNGDVLTDLDPRRALDAHLATGADTTMVLRPMPKGADFAPVEVDARGNIARIAGLGREAQVAEELRSFAFTGIHVLTPAIFETLPADGASCVNRAGHVGLIRAGRRVSAHVEEGGRWSDVGTPERYLEANLDLLEGRYRLPSVSGFQMSAGIVVAEGASIEDGASLVAPSYVGPGVTVRAGAKVGPRAVLHEGCVVEGEVVEAVVPPGGLVSRGRTVRSAIA
ncbi:sugar phosphate nucleotidyltransferase [Vulgatibacter incomptus]|nr:sugar phosphate nucleotidyltransferase [Vulgatibacter incomptus]